MSDQGAKPDDHVASAKMSVDSHPESRVAAAHAMDSQHRQAVEKSMKRKLDTRCALFVLIYIMNYLDRNNMAAARLKGLQEDLNLSYNQYATCLSILYVGYILMQVPSNMFINRIQRPSLYISAAMLLWGLISTLSGSVHNFAGMVCIRFFLGFIEAAFPARCAPHSVKVVHAPGVDQAKRHSILRQPHLQRLLRACRRWCPVQHAGCSWSRGLAMAVLD
jgi:hypothetical protein